MSLCQVVHGLQGDGIKKSCFLVIDGLTIPWLGKFSADALDNRLKDCPLAELSSSAVSSRDIEGYIQVSETVLRERKVYISCSTIQTFTVRVLLFRLRNKN